MNNDTFTPHHIHKKNFKPQVRKRLEIISMIFWLYVLLKHGKTHVTAASPMSEYLHICKETVIFCFPSGKPQKNSSLIGRAFQNFNGH